MSGPIQIGESMRSGPTPEKFALEIIVTCAKEGAEARIRGAIGQDGELSLIETTTPYRKQFRAWQVIVMFESLDEDVPILVELEGDLGRPLEMGRKISSFMAPHGGIAQDFLHDRTLGSGQIYG